MSNDYYSILRIGPIILHDGDHNNSNDNATAAANNDNAAILIRKALLSHFRNNNNNNNNILSISNRYFDANVLLLELDDDSTIPHHHQEDGVILIFNDDDDDDDDANHPTTAPMNDSRGTTTTFDALDQIHSNISVTPRKRANGTNYNHHNHQHGTTTITVQESVGDLLRLCIGTTTTTIGRNYSIAQEEYSRRMLWCLDRGYEYIQVDLSQSNNDWKTAGFDERDKDGYARVIEAIETCLWSSRVTKKAIPSSSSSSKTNASTTNNEVAVETRAAIPPEDGRSAVPDDAEGETAAVVASWMNNNCTITRDDDDSNYDVDAGPGDGSQRQRQHRKEHGDNHNNGELAFDHLERLLSEARSIREASTSNSLSDVERREKAGSTAMKLMELLDHLGLDDDEEEEE